MLIRKPLISSQLLKLKTYYIYIYMCIYIYIYTFFFISHFLHQLKTEVLQQWWTCQTPLGVPVPQYLARYALEKAAVDFSGEAMIHRAPSRAVKITIR